MLTSKDSGLQPRARKLLGERSRRTILGICPKPSRTHGLLLRFGQPFRSYELYTEHFLRAKCVPEKLAIKRQVVLELSKNAPASAVIASNSSSYSISKVLEDLSVKNPERFLSLHCCEYLVTNVSATGKALADSTESQIGRQKHQVGTPVD